jgi:SAM-dependent methyltransferase
VKLAHYARQVWLGATSRSSGHYWDRRYRLGMNSGPGSYGELAQFKAEVLNAFVRENDVQTIAELGCGDGNQLKLAAYPRYLGLDVSRRAVQLCAERFASDPSKSFLWYDPACTVNLAAFVSVDLTLSLDVIYHLLEDRVYRRYLQDVFSLSRRFVIVYSSDRADNGRSAAHVRHWNFTADVQRSFPQFDLIRKIPNRHPELSHAEFFIFRRRA